MRNGIADEDSAELSITFTGDRRGDHFRVYVHGRPVELTANAVSLFVELVAARGHSGPGYVQASSVEVCRLRRSLDQAIAPGTGKALIETGSGQEYRLTIPRAQIGHQVEITTCFFELVELGVISGLQAEALKRLARLPCAIQDRQTENGRGN